eukprot:155947_1
MSTSEVSTKWINLLACPITDYMISPTGTSRSNYIIIDRKYAARINCIYKYNIDTNKWNKISGLNNIQSIAQFSALATLDVNKQILYLIDSDSVSEIQLNDGNINNYTHNTTINVASTSITGIILNDSLFIIGGRHNKSIFKWDLENKTLT